MYLKINLLPQELRPRKSLIAVDFRVFYGLAVVIAAVALGGYYMHIERQIAFNASQLQNLRQQETILQDMVNLQSEVNGLRENVAERIAVIRELTGDSDLRFAMFQYLNDITPENLWLLRIAEENDGTGITFAIEGMSYSKQDISAFLAELQKFEHFSAVALESIRPAPTEIRDAYQYSVRVTLKTAAKTAAPAQTARRR